MQNPPLGALIPDDALAPPLIIRPDHDAMPLDNDLDPTLNIHIASMPPLFNALILNRHTIAHLTRQPHKILAPRRRTDMVLTPAHGPQMIAPRGAA